MTYSEKLKDPRWQKLRLEVMQRDEFTCCHCGDRTTTLNVHHLRYHKNPWDTPLEELITLCNFCHLSAEHAKDWFNRSIADHDSYNCLMKLLGLLSDLNREEKIKVHQILRDLSNKAFLTACSGLVDWRNELGMAMLEIGMKSGRDQCQTV